MSEDADESSKTEEPTQKKLDEAHKQGNWPLSQEVAATLSIAAATTALVIFIPGMLRDMLRRLEAYIAKLHEIPMDAAGVGHVLMQALADVVAALWLPMLLFIGAALLATYLQKGFATSWQVIEPKFSKLSPLAGLKRIFTPSDQAVQLGKSIAKLAVVGAVAYLALTPMIANIQLFIGADVMQLLRELDELAFKLFTGVLVVSIVIAAADTFWQRYRYHEKMKMTKQEIKEEGKQAEGDPHVKARIRGIRIERARKRMMASVPQASVVVTNPTHFAVALKYEQGAMGAPVVVAKGVDAVAFKIREVAEANDVPVVQNPPLARALYAACDIDEEVPSEHYRAVAEVITYIYKLKGRR
ncbi:MAG TPA: flagellar biosynthesis protein FlhB [Azospirillaceae bacterium]|nr:flagellar biosynthesis protein FlhB [Azospirillaceae bacterium]HRQ82764.1 flagellar biosynthesis protein FlhB [Azospirillaceae bacterium]